MQPLTTTMVRTTTRISAEITMREITQGTITILQIATTVSKDRIDNGSIPTNNNNNAQFVDINQYDSNQNVPNDDGSYFNGNQEVNQNSQGNNNESPMQYNAMMLESYDSPQS